MDGVIAVALSGGVDSSVAAWLLHQDHKRMVGASHYILEDSSCCNIHVFIRAQNLCDKLDIPYFKIDQQEEFKACVIDDFIDTYLAGETPNPCIRCNERIRFTRFYDALKVKLVKEGILKEGENLYFATGHYANIVRKEGRYFLKKGKDPLKDQTYMLSRIPKEYLPFMIFPMGDYTKPETLEIAKSAGLPSASVRESQDACFLKGEDYTGFIIESTGRDDLNTKGPIVDPDGTVLGEHRGYIHYTIGQRKGLGLGNGPWYVMDIDAENNIIVVARAEDFRKTRFGARELNWFIDPPAESMECDVKIRYQSKPIACKVIPAADGQTVTVELERPATISPGQSAVFYDDDLVIGGGIITQA